MSEKEYEEQKRGFIQSILDDKAKSFKDGKRVAYEDIKLRNVEIFRHNNIKHIMLPICYLFGHKLDILTQFCSRCNISTERLMK